MTQENSDKETQILVSLGFWDILADINSNMLKADWSKQQGRTYLKNKYGTHSRFRLTDEQLIEFRDYLANLPKRKESSLLKKRKRKR